MKAKPRNPLGDKIIAELRKRETLQWIKGEWEQTGRIGLYVAERIVRRVCAESAKAKRKAK